MRMRIWIEEKETTISSKCFLQYNILTILFSASLTFANRDTLEWKTNTLNRNPQCNLTTLTGLIINAAYIDHADAHCDADNAIASGIVCFVAISNFVVHVPGVADRELRFPYVPLLIIDGLSNLKLCYESNRIMLIADYYARCFNGRMEEYLVQCSYLKRLECFPGYAVATNSFTVDRRGFVGPCGLGDSNIEWVVVYMSPLNQCIIDSVTWLFPLASSNSSCNWYMLISQYSQLTNILSQHSWLASWKSAKAGRYISVVISPVRVNDEFEYTAFGVEPWKAAGLRGYPQYRVDMLDQDHDGSCEFYVGTNEVNVVISHHIKVTGQHWLDPIEVSAHPFARPRQSILVATDGVHRVFEVPFTRETLQYVSDTQLDSSNDLDRIR